MGTNHGAGEQHSPERLVKNKKILDRSVALKQIIHFILAKANRNLYPHFDYRFKASFRTCAKTFYKIGTGQCS